MNRRYEASPSASPGSPAPPGNVALLNRARDAISRLQSELADSQRRAAKAEHALGEARTQAELADRRAEGLEFSLHETRSELQALYDAQQKQLRDVGASTASLRGRLAGLDDEMRERAMTTGSLAAERNALQEQVCYGTRALLQHSFTHLVCFATPAASGEPPVRPAGSGSRPGPRRRRRRPRRPHCGSGDRGRCAEAQRLARRPRSHPR